MKLNQKFIKQLRNGEIAADNNGTLEQLTRVLKAAFPKDGYPLGSDRFYFMHPVRTNEWTFSSVIDIPTKNVSDFYESEPKPQPKKSNPIHYLVDGMEYSFNYQELKFRYEDVVNYSDEQFMEELPKIAHLACIVAYFKGLGNSATIGDKGIIHELIHLMTDPDEPTNNLQEIRKSFNDKIKLV